MFYLTMHSTHFIYGYMASDIWLRTILIVRKETRCHHIGYSYRLTARVLLYAPSHRQDSTYHSLCYTSRGALAGTRNSATVIVTAQGHIIFSTTLGQRCREDGYSRGSHLNVAHPINTDDSSSKVGKNHATKWGWCQTSHLNHLHPFQCHSLGYPANINIHN